MSYESLYKRYKEQSKRSAFAEMVQYTDEFSSLTPEQKAEHSDKPWRDLSTLAKDEEWNFHRDEFKRAAQKYPILTSYLNYTFLRLQELDLISLSDDGTKACFNTGLQTPQEQDIFATFFRNKRAEELGYPDWTLFGFFERYSQHLAAFEPLPEVATYINDPTDLVFDLGLEINVNLKHILEDNISRFPEILRSNHQLALNTLEGAMKLLKGRLKRNYKLAIPHWHDGRIQLLLPLYLTSDTVADLALLVEKDKSRNQYMARTALTMDQAYNNARLLTRPDRDWLNP